MKKTLQLFTLVWLSLAFMPARAVQLSGAYTIDSAATASATEFKDFTSAIIYMTSTGTRPDGGPSNSGTVGVSGPVVFTVLQGTYTEQVNIPAIPGVSATNTVTFDGGASNASTRILQFLATATSDNHTLRFNACSFVHFRNITIKALGGTAGVGVQFLGAVNNNSVRQCSVIVASTTNTSVKAINITNTNVSATGNGCSGSAAASYLIFIDSNYIFGGCIGVFMSSSATTQSGGNFNFYIRWNEIIGAGATGVGASGTQGYIIKWNYIKLSTLSASSKGIHHCNGSTSGINYYDVSYNVIEDAGAYGIHFQSNNANTSALYPTRITNNYIKPTFRSATSYGMDFSQPRNHKVFHNTILMNQPNGVGINLGASANAACIIKNNIIQLLNTASTNLCIISGGANLDSCDYNVFTKGGSQPNLLSVRGATYTRANFIGGGGNNVFSTMDDPMILGGVNDPRPSNICQKGQNHWLVDTLDLNGTLRGVPPQIGCAESVGGISSDANPVAILEPVSFPVVSGAQNAKVIIKNSGTATLTSLNVSIQIGTVTTTVGWTGSLLSCEIDTVEFTGINQITLAAGTNVMRVWTDGPNAGLDSNASNDTIQKTFCTPLATGNYTIGATGTFSSFAQVADILNCGGVLGTTPTIFDVEAGVYTEQFALGTINGVTENTPLIFRSLDLNADSVKITLSSPTSNNYLVQMAGTNYTTFEHITFQSLNTAAGRIFEIGGTASFNKIQNCNLLCPVLNTTGNTLAHIFANGVTGKRNEIRNNSFVNGSYGVYLYGPALISATDSNVIDNNVFTNVYYMTIACSFNSNIQITRNIVSPNTTYASTYGIYLINSANGNNISYNRVQGQVGTGGIYLSSVNGTALLPGRVTNNVVTGGTTGTFYGLYMGSCTNMLVSHNSVSANSSGTTNYAFYSQFTSTTGTTVVVRNNVFRSTGTALTNTNAAMYVYHKDYLNSNYNNIFSQNHNVLVNVATPAIQHLDLFSWRAANPYEKNTVSYQTGFTNNNNATPNPADSASWSLNGHGTYLPYDTMDFVGNPRPMNYAQGAPDLGAFEFTPTSVPPLATTTASQLAPDSMQIFMFAGDTVAKVKWSPSYSAPTSIFVRQFCGMRPPHIDTMATNHMNFHTNFEVPFGFYGYDLQLFYKENWRGLMQNETDIRMAKFDSSLMFIAPWTAFTGTSSSVDTIANIISAPGLSGFSFFTGTDDNNPLPVVLGRFVASKENSDAALFWTTASEVNSDRFEIERSVDGRNFTAVGRVNASGNSNTLKSYRYMDVNPLMGRKGIAYYRLKMIDRDRSYAYSQVVTVDFGRELRPIGLSLFPNPYTNDFNAIVEIDHADKGEVVVYDLQGKIMHAEAKSFEAGENNVYINTLAGLPAGVYVLEVKTNNHQQVIRFVKGN
jgi:trimeric autotransporter adhesin